MPASLSIGSGLIALAAFLAAVNLAAGLLFWWDKAAARRRGRRVPERVLLWVAALGGSPGAQAAQHLLRHKTRKQPFANRLVAIVAAQLCLLFAAWMTLLLTKP